MIAVTRASVADGDDGDRLPLAEVQFVIIAQVLCRSYRVVVVAFANAATEHL
jgi:hypothetical protein